MSVFGTLSSSDMHIYIHIRDAFKGTVRVISNDPPWKNVQFAMYPQNLKVFSHQVWKSIFLILNTDFFQLWIFYKITYAFLLQLNILELSELKTFQFSKTPSAFTLLISYRFQAGTFGNRPLSSMHLGSLEILFTALSVIWREIFSYYKFK